jgi:hypothetical protein
MLDGSRRLHVSLSALNIETQATASYRQPSRQCELGS